MVSVVIAVREKGSATARKANASTYSVPVTVDSGGGHDCATEEVKTALPYSKLSLLFIASFYFKRHSHF